MQIRNRLTKIVAASYLSFIVIRALGFILVTIMYYRIGINFLGVWLFMLAFIGYFKYAWGSLNQSFSKDIAIAYAAKDDAELNKILIGSLIIMFVVGLIMGTIVFFFGHFFIKYFPLYNDYQPVLSTVFMFLICYLMIASLTIPFQSLLSARQRMDEVHLIETMQALFDALLSLGIVIFYPSLKLVVGAYLLNQLIVLIIYLIIEKELLRKIFKGKVSLPSWLMIKRQISFSSSLIMIAIAGIVLFQVDVTVIAYFLTAASVAVYGVCQKIYNLPMDFSIRISTGILPATSYLSGRKDPAQIKALFMLATKYSMIVYFSIGLPIFIYSYPLLGNWFGPKFANAGALVLSVLLFHQWFNINHCVGMYMLKGLGHVKELLFYSWVCAIFNLTLSLVLIHYYGILGVAIGTTIPFIIFEAYIMRCIFKYLQISWQNYSKQVLFPIYWPIIVILVFHYLFINPKSLNLFATIIGISLTSLSLFLFYVLKLNDEEKKPIFNLLGMINSKMPIKFGCTILL